MPLIYRIVTFLLMLFGILFVAPEFWEAVKMLPRFDIFKWFYLGVGVYVALRVMPFLQVNSRWLETTSHEFSHALIGLLFLKDIKSLKVNENGSGEVWHSGNGIGKTCISLAPYTFPLFTYVLMIISLLLSAPVTPMYQVLMGFTFAFHVKCFAWQTRLDQTDITSQGLVRSFVFITLFLMLNTAIVLMATRYGFADGVERLSKAVLRNFVMLWVKVF